MGNTTTQYECNNCGTICDGLIDICQNCGHTAKNISLGLNDTVALRDDINLKKFVSNKKKFAIEVKKGWAPSGDLLKHPEGVYRTQVVDRENNSYIKKVEDVKTGKLLKDIKEPLSKHK